MFDINDFLGYATNGQTTSIAPQAKKRRTSAPQPKTAPVAAPAPKAVKYALPSGPMQVKQYAPVLEVAEPTQTIVPEAPKEALELVAYSDKAFAIFGDTKPVKDQLEALGGKFNYYLKRDGKSTPGFIFSNKRLDSVKKALNI